MAVDMVKAKHNSYNLILMDMHMPGMDGQTATMYIRRYEEENKLPKIPVIALTGDKSEGYRNSCLEAGCDECILDTFVLKDNIISYDKAN
jgi:CheY-like chemotaxis protein